LGLDVIILEIFSKWLAESNDFVQKKILLDYMTQLMKQNDIGMENIQHQIQRTEELIKVLIIKLEKSQEISIQSALEHTNGSKETRNNFLAGIGVIVGILSSLLSIDLVDHVAVLLWLGFFLIIGLSVYIGSNRRLRKLNDAFGRDITSYDLRIKPLRQMLEDFILMTINAYEGHIKAVRETATLVSFLNNATQLYHIIPYEKLIATGTYPRENNETMHRKIKYLKAEANFFYKQYMELKHERIPLNFRSEAEKVFLENNEFIDRTIYRQPS